VKPAVLSDQELLERFQQRRATPHVPDALSPLPESVRLALALLPTSTMAALATLDTNGAPIGPALDALSDQGLIEADSGALPSTQDLRRPASGLIPAVRPSAKLRQRVLDAFTATHGDPARSAKALREAAQGIGATLEASSIELPETTHRWVRLAAANTAAASRLDAEAQAAAERRDSADLSRWIDAAVPLAALFERDKDLSLRLGVERAGRQLELLRREQADLRHLETFFPRAEQIEPLEAFLDGRGGSDRWMLHLLGSGGVGKTMLIRHLTLQMAKARGFLSARVDFDFLSPDYPRLDPGLLLWSLGRELQLRTTNEEAVRAFREAEGKFRHLSDVLHAQRGTSGDIGERTTRHPLFVEAAFLFVSALKLTSMPIVIVLDTCEELVKGRGRGGASDAVAETFRILHALRYGARSLQADKLAPGEIAADVRVVFAGRRPLASAGDGWTATSDLETRPGLQVFELRGFSNAEAEQWLGRHLQVPPDLIPAVIAATPDIDPGARVTWSDGQRTQEIGKNPYDLKHFADWAKETPPPPREVLASGSTRQYVEERILSKLEPRPDLERFLAALTLLKHADRALLQAVVDVERFDERLDALTSHEWIVSRVVPQPDERPRVIYQLEERLRRRLRAYFDDAGVDFAAIGQRAAPWLRTLTMERDLGFVDVADADAALRAFELDPAAGRTWWRAFVQRVVQQRGVDGVPRYTDFLLGDEQAAGRRASPQAPREHPLRAQVMADQTAALTRTGALADASRDWMAVAEILGGRTTGFWQLLDPTTVGPLSDQLLAIRSLSGQIAALAPRFDVPQLTHVVTLLKPVLDRVISDVSDRWAEPDAPALFATLAALEAIVERLEQVFGPDSRALRGLAPLVQEASVTHVVALATSDGPAASVTLGAAMCCVALGRALTYLGNSALAETCFVAGRSGLRRIAGAPAPSIGLDWAPPADPTARAVVEALRHGAGPSAEGLRRDHIDSAIEMSLYAPVEFNADRDRLWALLLLDATRDELPGTRTGPGSQGNGVATQIEVALKSPVRAPQSAQAPNAHRLIPPLAIVGAQLACQQGRLSAGLTPLLAAAGNQALDRSAREHAARVLLQLAPILRRSVLDRGVLDESTTLADQWTVARARFVCDRFGVPQSAAVLRGLVEDQDLLLDFVRPESEGEARSRLPPRDSWRLTPGRITAVHGPLRDGRRAARIDTVAGQLFSRREEARSLFDAGDLLGFVDPVRAESLLRRAASLYEESNDRLGRCAALARLAVLLASYEAADVEAIDKVLGDCQVTYEQLTASAPDERWTTWSAIVEGEPLVSHAGTATDWPFRLALCYVRLRELRIQTPRRESAFSQRQQVFMLHGAVADALQLLGRDPWRGDTGEGSQEPAWVNSLLWRMVKNSPAMRRLIAALIRVLASFVDAWIRFSERVNRRTNDAPSPKELLLRRLETTAAYIDVPEPSASETVASEPREETSAPADDEAATIVAGPQAAAPAQPMTPEPPAVAVPQPQPAPSPIAPPAGSASPRAAAPASASISPWLIVLGVAIWIGIGVVGFRFARPVLRVLTGQGWLAANPSASWWQVSGEIVVFILLIFAIFALLGGVTAWVAHIRDRRSIVVLGVLSDESVLEARVTMNLAVARSRFPRRGHQPADSLASDVARIDLLQASASQIVLSAPYRQIRTVERVVLLASGTLARRAPWEFLLADSLQIDVDRIRLVRRGGAGQASAFASLPPTPTAAGASPARMFLFTGHEASARFAEDAWRVAGSKVDITRPTWPLGVELQSRGRYRVVHLIGDVESRGADLRVRPAAEGASIGVGEISEMFGVPALIVLQGPLRPQQTAREDSDRLDAGARRELAWRLHETGVPLVLMLPRLDPSTLPEVLSRLVEAATRADDVDTWLDAVGSMRAAIRKRVPDNDGRELAGDVCLFAGDWNERVVP
jgi:hypothetical protein